MRVTNSYAVTYFLISFVSSKLSFCPPYAIMTTGLFDRRWSKNLNVLSCRLRAGKRLVNDGGRTTRTSSESVKNKGCSGVWMKSRPPTWPLALQNRIASQNSERARAPIWVLVWLAEDIVSSYYGSPIQTRTFAIGQYLCLSAWHVIVETYKGAS
jgi:hypothetical protein